MPLLSKPMMLFTISGLYASSTGPSPSTSAFSSKRLAKNTPCASTEEHTQPAAKPTANKAKIFLIHKNLRNQ